MRPAPEYAAGHLPGAVHIPLEELPQRLDELPPDREVVVAGLRVETGAACGTPGHRHPVSLDSSQRASVVEEAAVVGVGAFEQDPPGGLVWIPEGTAFGFDDLVFYRGKGEVPFEEVAPRVDLILTGPHATA
ncbi:MAG TPA: rhodanese-like domain-containing protein, partial [Humibacillus xanthopallidus]|nr:rhodanese-like domain-containing protein [Humibacillus xanthopallidus]